MKTAKEIAKFNIDTVYETGEHDHFNPEEHVDYLVNEINQHTKEALEAVRDEIQIKLIDKQLPSNARLLNQTIKLINEQIEKLK